MAVKIKIGNKNTSINRAWTKLKKYRRKIVATNTIIKLAYPNKTLFFTLIIALQKQNQYTAILDNFLSNPSLFTVEKKKKIWRKKNFN